MSDTVKELLDYLVDAGVFTGFAQDAFISKMPDLPNHAACLYSYSGAPSEGNFGQEGVGLEHPRVQLKFRDPDYETAVAWANRAHRVCMFFFKTLGGTVWNSCIPLQSPFLFGYDDKNRAVMEFNVDTEKEPSL